MEMCKKGLLTFAGDCISTPRTPTGMPLADDTCLLNIKNVIKEINKHVNKDLNSFSKQLNANKTFLNITKTEVILYKRKGRVFGIVIKMKSYDKKLFTRIFWSYI